MSKIIVGCWDCSYCGAKKIPGSIRNCPACSHPRDQDVKFYMADPNNYAENPEEINKNPDWICSYCNSLNSDSSKFCTSCGASREDSEANYFENQEKQKAKEREKQAAQAAQAPQARGGGGKRLLPILLIGVLLIALVFWLTGPKTKTLSDVECHWERAIAVERDEVVKESGWQQPAGAFDVTTRREVYDYEQVLDHYEQRSRRVSEQVFDGYDVSYNYVDMGNGYFEQQEVQTPRYRTEYHTEYYDEPIYRDEPVYKTKYYYSIHEWLFDRYETTSGVNDTPYFASLDLGDDERENGRYEQYWVVSQGSGYNVDYDLWAQITPGSTIKVKVQGDQITELK